MSKNKKVALVTDLKVIDSPQAGIGVARCLKEAGFVVIGVICLLLHKIGNSLIKFFLGKK